MCLRTLRHRHGLIIFYYDYQREVHATNENLTKRVAPLAAEMQRTIATPDETRGNDGYRNIKRELSGIDAGYNFTALHLRDLVESCVISRCNRLRGPENDRFLLINRH